MKTPHTVFQDRRLLESAPRLIVLWIAVGVAIINAAPSPVASNGAATQSDVVLQTTTAPMLSGTFQVLNDGPGDQADPHISCDLASYTDDDFFGTRLVGYFDFATNTNHLIPGNGTGSLSDVNAGLVVFTEATTTGPVIVLFNTATQIRSVVPGFHHSHPAVGGNLIVFENRSFSPNINESEISVYDRSTGTVGRLTNEALLDKNPRISPTGDAIVWEKCQSNGTGCDVYSAIPTGLGVFTARALTVANGEDVGAHTNGNVAVYLSNRTGENDIYFQPVAGGAETQLSIPGDQRDVNIAGNLISFESRMDVQYDLFVYDINTGNLYQVTNTPVNETLNDITVCNGVGRIVYSAPGMDFNVYSFTFQVPSSTENDIEDLIELVESFNLPKGLENSLITKLQNALTAIEVSDTATACISLSAFISESQAQSGKKLTADQATQLINSANQIKTDLGCQ